MLITCTERGGDIERRTGVDRVPGAGRVRDARAEPPQQPPARGSSAVMVRGPRWGGRARMPLWGWCQGHPGLCPRWAQPGGGTCSPVQGPDLAERLACRRGRSRCCSTFGPRDTPRRSCTGPGTSLPPWGWGTLPFCLQGKHPAGGHPAQGTPPWGTSGWPRMAPGEPGWLSPPGISMQTRPQPVLVHLCPWGHCKSASHSSTHGLPVLSRLSAGAR